MQETQPTQREAETNHNTPKPLRLRWLFFSVGFLFGFLLAISWHLPEITERVKFVAANGFSALALIVIIAQAVIYYRQREVMAQQWDAMNGQLRAIRRQERHMRVQAKAALKAADMATGQLVAMQHQEQAQFAALEETRKIVQQNERTIEATEKNVEIAQRTSIYSQRAYVTAKIRDIGERDNALQFRLRIENSGNTPANDVVVVYSHGLREQPPHRKDADTGLVVYESGFTETERLGVIAPNGSYQVVSTPEIEFHAGRVDEYRRFETGELIYYCWGTIIYEDIFNEKRRSEFCFYQSIKRPFGYPCEYGNRAD